MRSDKTINPGQVSYTGIFNDSFPPILDGVTLTVENYLRWLKADGHLVCMVTPRNPVSVPTDFKVLRYFSLPIRSRKPYRYGYPYADPMIWLRLSTTPFRLVHAHCPFSSGRLAAFTSRRQRIPLIGTFHSKYRDDLRHSFTRMPWMTELIMQRILDFFNACDQVWIPQDKVAETLREYGYKGKCHTVENGNDLADRITGDPAPYKAAARERVGIPAGPLALLFVGQHIREKGTFIILETLRLLAPDTDFRMNFIGSGYALESMKRFVEEAGLTSRVTFHGIITDRDTISDYYAASDMFLFPSPYDNAPLVVREAAAMHTPSILLKGSTAAEHVADRRNGFLTSASPADLASYIRLLDSRRDLIADAAEGARRTLVRSWRDVVAEVEERYDDIVRTHKRGIRR